MESEINHIFFFLRSNEKSGFKKKNFFEICYVLLPYVLLRICIRIFFIMDFTYSSLLYIDNNDIVSFLIILIT